MRVIVKVQLVPGFEGLPQVVSYMSSASYILSDITYSVIPNIKKKIPKRIKINAALANVGVGLQCNSFYCLKVFFFNVRIF